MSLDNLSSHYASVSHNMYRHVDIRIVSLLSNPECKLGEAAYDIAMKIAKSMSRK